MASVMSSARPLRRRLIRVVRPTLAPLFMGEIYAVAPVDSKVREFLRSQSVAVPQEPSRGPTFTDIQDVLARLDGYSVESDPFVVGAPWDAQIASRTDPYLWTRAVIHELAPSDCPQSLSFHKGASELVAAIVLQLTQTCGPLIVFTGSGALPLVVSSRDSIHDLLSSWDL